MAAIRNVLLAAPSSVLERGLLGDRGPARENQLLQLGDKGGRRRGGGEPEALAHDGERARIDRIGLGELADRFGEQTRTQRIDDSHRVACGVQRAMGLTMELAGCLDGDEDDLETGKPRLELPEPLVGVGNAERVAKRMQINVDCRFTDIETDVDLHFGFCFGRVFALHAGRAPNHLFRTRAEGGRTKLSRGACTQGRTVPPAWLMGDGHPP